MGILSGIASAVMQVTHSVAKATDEVAERTNAFPIVRAATSSFVEATSRALDWTENSMDAALSNAGSAVGKGVAGMVAAVGDAYNSIAAAKDDPAPAQEVEKLGRSAHHYNGQVVSPSVMGPEDYSLASLGDMPLQSIGTDMNAGRSAGAGMSNYS